LTDAIFPRTPAASALNCRAVMPNPPMNSRLSTLSDSPAESRAKSDRSALPYSAAYASSSAACSLLRSSRV